MYNRVGKKIKSLVKILLIVEIIVAVIGGVVMIAIGGSYMILPGFLTMIVGPFLAWISSWVMYGYGEIIDKLTDIEINTRKNNASQIAETENKRNDELKNLLDKGLITAEEYNSALVK